MFLCKCPRGGNAKVGAANRGSAVCIPRHSGDDFASKGRARSTGCEPGRFAGKNIAAAAAPSDTGIKCDMLARQAFDVCFDSAAQIDQFGNLNITAIGDYRKPKVRLVGCLAQPEHLAFVPRPIVVVDLDKRVFVEKVDFITSVGHYKGGRSREEVGLPAGGPQIVVTDKAIFDFEPESKRMRLASLHRGVTKEEVLDNMSFVPVVPQAVATTPEPDDESLRLIRSEIDPNRVLLRV